MASDSFSSTPPSTNHRTHGKLPRKALTDDPATEMRLRAVALAERLVRLADRAGPGGTGRSAHTAARPEVALINRLLLLEQQRFGAQIRPASGAAPEDVFTPPADPHPWPRRDRPDGPSFADPYDLRPDDGVVAALQLGRAFTARFRLQSGQADLLGARASLAAAPPTLHLAGAGETPDVSIIIPVHGQIGHTLNCLDSLYRHVSRAGVELIVIDDASPDETAAMLAGLPHLTLLRQEQNRGFIHSCNAGAALARGNILVLLNNDTRVVEGWLDALVDSFDRAPQAGLVGAKLFSADGSLQEAGGIVWRDGSAWNYGRGDDPNRPQYCHAREVDFVSGASIAVPRLVWQAMGGFDAHYAPAYCEDVDLALRISEAGWQVWFQPLARVIHYEGATGGRDVTQGVKAYQTINTVKLAVRWQARLAAHRPNGRAPYFERERHVQRRALVIEASMPTPHEDAGSVVAVTHLQLLQRLGFKTYFMPQDNFLFQPEPAAALLAMGVECLTAPYALGVERTLQRYGALFDLVLVFRVGVLAAVLPALRTHAPQATVLFHNQDLHFLRMRREAQLTGDAQGLAAAAAMQTLELGLIAEADATLTLSSFERAELARLVPSAPVLVMPYIMTLHGTDVPFERRRDICFLGGYRHGPNVDAVTWFTSTILPLLQRAQPGLRFIIAGANPTADVRALAGESVTVTGRLEDLRPLLDSVRVFVCPLRVGAGVKGKLVTALSYGVPIVTTGIGAEGLDLRHGHDALIAETPADFAQACLRLYRDAALWRHLSLAGQDKVRRDFSDEAGRRALRRALDRALEVRLSRGRSGP